MLSLSFFCWSLASLLTPGSASNSRAIILARIVVGISQGFLIPSVHTGTRWDSLVLLTVALGGASFRRKSGRKSGSAKSERLQHCIAVWLVQRLHTGTL